MKHFIIILIFIISLNILAFDTDTYLYQKSTNVGFALLKITPDAISQSLGNTGTAGYDSPSAYLLNPAIPNFNNENNISFSYKNSLNYLNYGFIHTNIKIYKGYLLAGLSYVHSDTMQLRGDTPTSEPLGEFNYSSLSMSLGYSTQISNGVHLGFDIRSINEYYYLQNQMCFVFNGGFLFTFDKIKGFSFGLSFLNIGPEYRYDEYSFDYIKPPFTVRIGAKEEFTIKDNFDINLLSDIVKINDAEYTLQFGSEIFYNQLFAFRLGYKYNDETQNFSSGFALNWNEYSISYSIINYKYNLGIDNIITLVYRF